MNNKTGLAVPAREVFDYLRLSAEAGQGLEAGAVERTHHRLTDVVVVFALEALPDMERILEFNLQRDAAAVHHQREAGHRRT